ncbi:hypothetical protein CGMCC3_g1460 [Colletotrichum fructicola]|uniref:Uncharacterized protein n=1 Tax=Colletotrichum fructicola (strain Nara gc5) TaxID=1213859 RepID=A0A7J6J7Z0_COLFN|nr:uncharacterized protein CGMCC3_g1460 [Colletotrichum fructicola]KAE9582539.1 hypothetical protein CGMCC3_g1460 [Colletotrichum fructicola]KAF4484688.1 hypothetical protein CGGC5_v008197 [Colletotrichum fructicola Nara gc5]
MRAIPVIRLLFGQQVLQIFAVDVGQASNYYVSAEVAQQYSCGDACQQAIAEGNAEDLKIYGTRFDYDFYKTAANFSGSKPGDVLKFELNPPSNLSTPAGVAAYKIQYTSTDINGSYVPVTGFIALPFARTTEPFN